ncbi:uncharacterized protein [Mycetomoellerius zeteki]|uniref:uncharacterized protein n=1 Tax=Mycetomoellerius zeteki TaxID=64791 RepID=UPI00084E48B4|nr:PREDICTED: uncharacterized protein LOC108729061 [Trachymyrmex zeteki]
MEETEAGDNLIPARRWIRGHYTKLTSNEARCNHCNEKLSIHLNSLHTLHKHLIEAHPDKLAEEEKNEVKFHWVWDYYVKNSTEATCKQCKATVRYKKVYDLKRHLKRKHGILGPTSDNVIDNESSSDDDMNANKDITLRKDFVPVRLWIRGHYTRLTRNNEALCIHCNRIFIILIHRLSILHKHLVESHPDKLAEEEKNEVKFHWAWDYYSVKSSTEATCKQCKITIRYMEDYDLKGHLKIKHEIFGPGSDNHMDNENNSSNYVDADRNTTIKKAKYQEDLSNLKSGTFMYQFT